MQHRFARLLFASVPLGLFLAAIPAQAGSDLPRFPEQSARPASDDSQIAELEELLRQAQELQKAEQKAVQEKGARVVGRGVEASPPVVATERGKPAEGGMAKAEGQDPAANSEQGAEQGAEEKEAPSAARPGCMYRDTTLIWEKVPGTCKP